MRRLLKLLLLVLAAGGGGYYVQKNGVPGLDQLQPSGLEGTTVAYSDPVAPFRAGSTIRVATFNIQVFGESKMSKPHVTRILADVVRRFDVVAIQEIRAVSQEILPRFLAEVNSVGRQYDYVIGPRLGRTSSKEQYAYIYDTATVELDRESVYTVQDPDDLLHREPLVAAFRARGVPEAEAFTFTLVNVHTDPDEVREELNVLDDVYRAVRADGRGEDDILMLGDFNADDRRMGELGQVSGITGVIRGVPTNTRGTQMYDNILFTEPATNEFTGGAGVVDLMEMFHLTQEQALEVSDHLPVWGEFSVYEGGRGGRLATRPEEAGAR
ncbi:MAG: endonuclease/exonuclease/phosphatase family protein [Pirellulales bacterium]|nr:endonuclease/exonuclease/phosphatase family protein [Pirellulales bacterium]